MCCVRLDSFSIFSISEASVEKKSPTVGRKKESKVYLLKDRASNFKKKTKYS